MLKQKNVMLGSWSLMMVCWVAVLVMPSEGWKLGLLGAELFFAGAAIGAALVE